MPWCVRPEVAADKFSKGVFVSSPPAACRVPTGHIWPPGKQPLIDVHLLRLGCCVLLCCCLLHRAEEAAKKRAAKAAKAEAEQKEKAGFKVGVAELSAHTAPRGCRCPAQTAW